MPNFEEFDFKVGPSSIGFRRPFSTPIEYGGFARLKTYISNRKWKWMILTK